MPTGGDGGAAVCIFKDLLADLRQTESARRSIKQSYAESLLQQCYAPTNSRFQYPERTGGG
jgi:hypothetical protein